MQPTRKQIIQYLQTFHYATAGELSLYLNVTPSNIRYHLGELKEQGVLEDFGKHPQTDRGRPSRLVRLSKAYLDHNLDSLSEVLMCVFREDVLADMPEIMRLAARKMLGNYELNPNLFHRLNHAITWLNVKNYKSRWEASPQGPRVIFGLCPYLAIIDSNPEICLLDTALVSQLTGLPMKQIDKLERTLEGSRQCVFITTT